jgi:hypothetical protein
MDYLKRKLPMSHMSPNKRVSKKAKKSEPVMMSSNRTLSLRPNSSMIASLKKRMARMNAARMRSHQPSNIVLYSMPKTGLVEERAPEMYGALAVALSKPEKKGFLMRSLSSAVKAVKSVIPRKHGKVDKSKRNYLRRMHEIDEQLSVSAREMKRNDTPENRKKALREMISRMNNRKKQLRHNYNNPLIKNLSNSNLNSLSMRNRMKMFGMRLLGKKPEVLSETELVSQIRELQRQIRNTNNAAKRDNLLKIVKHSRKVLMKMRSMAPRGRLTM